MIENTEIYRFFQPERLSYSQAENALKSGCALLVSRAAFASEEELRRRYPPAPGEEEGWREKNKCWYEERRHMYLACINPITAQCIASSAEPDKSTHPWTLAFSSEEMETTQVDARVCQSEELWFQYNAAAVILPKSDYPPELIIARLQQLRLNLNNPIYSCDPKSGYDCQTATRDLLWAVCPSINPRNLTLPENTVVLAYNSEQMAADLLLDFKPPVTWMVSSELDKTF